MACDLTRGFALGCRDNVGGVNAIYIGNYDTAASNTVVVTSAAGAFSAVTGTVFRYEIPMGNATYTETVAQSRSNGTIFYEPNVTLKLHKLCASARNELRLLGQARSIIFVELNLLDASGNNTVICLGEQNGMMLESSNIQSGTAFGDYVGMEMAFKGMEQEPSTVGSVTMAAAAVTVTPGTFGQC